MDATANLSAREVADLAGTSKKLVESAIEDGVLRPRLVPRRRGRPDRLLSPHAVALAGVLAKLDLPLPLAHKRRLAEALERVPIDQLRSVRVELSPAVALDVGRLVGDTVERAERYAQKRDRYIEVNDAIKGGTAVIRGSRMTVYAVLGRIEHGETLDDLVADNPDIPRDAFEAALLYARTHPLVGRPSGRPWERKAA